MNYGAVSAVIAFMGFLVTVIFQGLYVAYKIGKLEQKLITLEEKQDRHNDIVSKVYLAESDIKLLKEKIKVENHRIEDLEGIQNEYIKRWNKHN